MDCSLPGFPVLPQLPELAQTHVYQVGDAIQPSHPLSSFLLLLSIFPSIRVFSKESVLCIRWPKYWSFNFSISSSNHSGSFSMSQFFASGGQSIGVSASASVLPMNNPLKSYTMDFKGRRLWCRFHHCSDFCVHVSLFVCMCLCVCALTLLGPQGHICRNTTLFQKNN